MTNSEIEVLQQVFGWKISGIGCSGKPTRTFRAHSRFHKAAEKLERIGLVTVAANPEDDYFVVVRPANPTR